MMKCADIQFGTGECAYNIHQPWLVEGKPYMANIDKCLLPEILRLWEIGIKTTGCCCGHGKPEMQPPYIGVREEYIGQMKAMGYEVQPNKHNPGAEDSFKPKTKLVYGDADKGFNWWDKNNG